MKIKKNSVLITVFLLGVVSIFIVSVHYIEKTKQAVDTSSEVQGNEAAMDKILDEEAGRNENSVKDGIFSSVAVLPQKTKIGDIQTTTVSVESETAIEKVVAQIPFEGGLHDEIILNLISGDARKGVWEGKWKDHDTLNKEYRTKILATDVNGKVMETSAIWWDDTVTYWYGSGWRARKMITITSSAADSDYQLQITIPYLNRMRSDFGDIVFTDSDGKTLLSSWRESYTASTSAVFWVKTSTPASLMSLNIFYYYGNPSANSAGTVGSVFIEDIGSLAGGWNLDEGTGGSGATTADGSGNSHPFTFAASYPTWTTNIDDALSFAHGADNSTGKDMSTASFALSGTAVTFASWIKISAPDTYTQYLLSGGVGNTASEGFLGLYRSGGTSMHNLFWQYAYTGNYEYASSSATFLTGYDTGSVWMLLTIVANYSTNRVYFYRNGELIDTVTPAHTMIFPSVAKVKHVGNSNGSNYYGTFGIDEIQLYSTALTATQIGHLYCVTGPGLCANTDSTRPYFSPAYNSHTLIRKYRSSEPGVAIATQEENAPGEPSVGISGGTGMTF